jgi:hypothetical protein
MSTAAFLERYDTFPEQIKEDLSVIAEYLLFSFNKKNYNVAAPSNQRMSDNEFMSLIDNAAQAADEGKVLSTEQAKELIKTWRKK